MKPPKFRVWDKVKKYYHDSDEFVLTCSGNLIFDNPEVDNVDDLEVQFYTGFNDCNGEEIYEGDIVEYERIVSEYMDLQGHGDIYKVAESRVYTTLNVEFRNGCFGAEVDDAWGMLSPGWYTLDNLIHEKEFSNLEIIGNSRNPELLVFDDE